LQKERKITHPKHKQQQSTAKDSAKTRAHNANVKLVWLQSPIIEK